MIRLETVEFVDVRGQRSRSLDKTPVFDWITNWLDIQVYNENTEKDVVPNSKDSNIWMKNVGKDHRRSRSGLPMTDDRLLREKIKNRKRRCPRTARIQRHWRPRWFGYMDCPVMYCLLKASQLSQLTAGK